MILDVYRDCFHGSICSRRQLMLIHFGFLLINIENDMMVQHTDDEPIYFDHYNPEALHEILDLQHKITKYTWTIYLETASYIYNYWWFCRWPQFYTAFKNAYYARGRHYIISTITATQKFNAIHPIIRVNAIEVYDYRLRNMKDIGTCIDEVSAVFDKQNIIRIISHSDIRTLFSFLNEIKSKK